MQFIYTTVFAVNAIMAVGCDSIYNAIAALITATTYAVNATG